MFLQSYQEWKLSVVMYGDSVPPTLHVHLFQTMAKLYLIPQRFTVTNTGDEFLKYDNHRAERILILAQEEV